MTEHRDPVAGAFSDYRRGDEAVAPLLPAATVALIRDSEEGLQTLMLKKNRGQAFGGYQVFPGGKVEEADHRPGADERDIAARAAVREADEETGVKLSVEALVPFAYWIPPPETPKRFSTWFFVAGLPADANEVLVDGGEIGDHLWTTPQATLARHRDGEVEVAPPTWISLWWLGKFTDVAAVLAGARSLPEVPRHETRMQMDGEVLVTYWAPDAAYETGDLSLPGSRNRLYLRTEGWRYDRS